MDEFTVAPHPGSQQRIVVSAVAARTAVSNALRKGYVCVKAIGADVEFQFGTDTVTLPVAGATGSGPTVGWMLTAGTEKTFYVNDTHIAHVASTGGFLLLGKGQGKKLSLP